MGEQEPTPAHDGARFGRRAR